MKTNKKKLGFTLVELLVVIAILAVLATVAIIGYSSFINEAHKSNDNSVVTELNHYLKAANPLGEEVPTATDAAEKLDGCGLNIAELQPSAKDAYYGYDYVAKEFKYVEGPLTADSGEITTFLFAKNSTQVKDIYKAGYSVYLQKAYSENSGDYRNDNFNAVKGLDVGEATVTAVNYSNSEEAQNVVIRTNGGKLIVNAPSDTVIHYGEADLVDIQKVASASYHENGTVSLVKVANGRVALESESNVGAIHLAATDGEFDNITVAKATNIEMPDFSRDPVEIPAAGKKVVALQQGTADPNANKDYVWLTAVGVYEQVTLGTVNAAGTNYAAQSGNSTQKEAAQQIANNITATYNEKEYEVKAVKVNDEWTYQLVSETEEDITENVTVSVAVENNVASASVLVGETAATASTSNSAVVTEDNIEAVVAHGASKTFAEIDSKEKLLAFRDAWNAGKLAGGTFKLTANIDISGEDWLPIGTWEYPFYGTIDGNGKTINGLTKTRLANEDVYSEGSSTKYNGVVFGFIAIAGGGDIEVKDLTLSNVNISLSAAANSSALIGYAPANGDFTSNSKGGAYWASTETEGKKVLPSNYGKDDITLTNVTVSGSISVKQHVGGLVGKMYSTGDISFTNCVNNSNITASSVRAGGLAGTIQYCSNATFENCSNSGTITNDGNGAYAGGLVAYSVTANNTFTNCSNTGKIISLTTNNSGAAGGLMGTGSDKDHVLELNNCSNSGDVSAYAYAGGLVGTTGNGSNPAKTITISGTISISGSISASSNVASVAAGGIIGSIYNGDTRFTDNGSASGYFRSIVINDNVAFIFDDNLKVETPNYKYQGNTQFAATFLVYRQSNTTNQVIVNNMIDLGNENSHFYVFKEALEELELNWNNNTYKYEINGYTVTRSGELGSYTYTATAN